MNKRDEIVLSQILAGNPIQPSIYIYAPTGEVKYVYKEQSLSERLFDILPNRYN